VPKVKLYGNLRKYSTAPALDVPGQTVAEAIIALCAQNDDLCEAILENGQLRPHYRVMLAGRDVELAQGMDTPVGEEDILAIFPPIAGGSAFEQSNRETIDKHRCTQIQVIKHSSLLLVCVYLCASVVSIKYSELALS
jgi:molybdopterin synthase sulfur carrier subunit